MAAVMQSARTGRDGWPTFPMSVSQADAERVSKLHAEFMAVKKSLNNASDAAIARASRQSTKEALMVERRRKEAQKVEILDTAAQLFFEITSKSTVQQHISPAPHTSQLSLDMDTVQKMCTAAALVALQQQPQQQQQQQQQSLALQNGGVSDALTGISAEIKNLNKVKEAAIDKLLDTPSEYETILDRAAERLILRKEEQVFKKAVESYMRDNEDDVILVAAQRIKRARHVTSSEEDEKETEEEEEEDSEDDA